MDRPPSISRPPVALGCAGLLGAVVLAAVTIGACAVFLESGANPGEAVLRSAEAYPPGSVDYVGDSNFFLVRTLSGRLVALADLDAANRASAGQRCRVHEANAPAELVPRMSSEVSGALRVFVEDCNGATYDLAGVRLDGDGANLDELAVRIRDDGRVVVDLRERSCSERTASELRVPVACVE